MKSLCTFRTIVAAAALAIGSLSLAAQSPSLTAKANVPFAFEVDSQHFAAGVYTISTPAEHVILIRDTKHGAMLMTHEGESVRGTKTTKIVFRKYGDRYFLRQVWFNASEKTYLETPESKAEKLAKTNELASTQTQPSDVEVAVLRIP